MPQVEAQSRELAPANSPAYRRLTYADHECIVALRKRGDTQTAIAQALGISQPTVCEVLKLYTPTKELASQYLDAHLLPLAERVVRDGDSRDAVKVLEGRGLLKRNEDKASGITIVVGGENNDVRIGVVSPVSFTQPGEGLQIP